MLVSLVGVFITCGPEVCAIGTGGEVPYPGVLNADLLLLDSPVFLRSGLGGLKMDCIPEAVNMR